MKKTVLSPCSRAALASALLSASVLAAGVLPAHADPKAAPTTTAAATTTPRAVATPKPVPSVALTSPKIAAEVGTDKIDIDDVNRLVQGIVDQNPKLAESTPEAQERLKKLRSDILDNMISQRLMLLGATDLKLTPTKEKIDEAVWDFQKTFDSQAAFNKWLTDEGKSMEDLRTLLSRRLAVEAYKTQIVSKVIISDADINKYYNDHKAEFVIPVTVSVRDILFTIPKGATDAEKKKLLQKAQSVLKSAQASNADFAALAKANSNDKATAARGGDMGLLTRDDIVDEAFAEAIFNAPVGKVYPKIVETKVVYSQVYSTVTGRLEDATVESPAYHIIRVEDKKPGRTLSLAEVTEYIKPLALKEKTKTALDNEVAALRAKKTVKKYI